MTLAASFEFFKTRQQWTRKSLSARAACARFKI